ncbi:MAG TPA: hypothetical protein VN716_10980 [Vicinamibacterales bacterium]|jgi:hypothetical protein|nr:hypothetical protein [Vicinamibacterales bacterium]
MAWLVIAVTLVLLAALGYGFFLSARMLMRDMNRRMAEFEAHLERDANAVLDELFR